MQTLAIWLFVYVPAAIFWLVAAFLFTIQIYDLMKYRRAKSESFAEAAARMAKSNDPEKVSAQMAQMR